VSRSHAFWDCSIARAVAREVQHALPIGTPDLTRLQMWTLTPPQLQSAAADGGIQQQAWDIVCLAAISAMDRGRCAMSRMHLSDSESTGPDALAVGRGRLAALLSWTQSAANLGAHLLSMTAVLTAGMQPTRAPTNVTQNCCALRASCTHLLRAKTVAAEAFWSEMADFETLFNARPPSRWPELPHSHPFMHTTRVPTSPSQPSSSTTQTQTHTLHLHLHTRPPPTLPGDADTLPPSLD